MSIKRARFTDTQLDKSLSQNLPYNFIQKSQSQFDQINSVKTAVFPKFFKQLNAQQNLKRRRQIRKKQKSIHQCIKSMIAHQIPLQKTPTQRSQKDKIKSVTFIFDPNSLQPNSFKQLNKIKNNQNSNVNRSAKSKKSIQKQKQQVIKDGNRILGQWKNQQLHGDVQIFYKNGYFFQGRYQHGIRIRGHFNFNNGYQYTGGFLGDRFRGYGQLKLPSGKMICGDWQEQLLDGKAEIRYPTGQVYYGEVKNFKKHGKGYLFFNEGHKYVGQFKQGHITGNGQYYQNQKLLGKGYWQDGQLICQQSIQKTKIAPKSILKNSKRGQQNSLTSSLKKKISLKLQQKSQKQYQHKKSKPQSQIIIKNKQKQQKQQKFQQQNINNQLQTISSIDIKQDKYLSQEQQIQQYDHIDQSLPNQSGISIFQNL